MSSPISVIPETTNLPPIPEIVTETPVSTAVPSPQVTPIFSSVQQTPTLIPTPPITTDAPTVTIAVPKSNALTAKSCQSSIYYALMEALTEDERQLKNESPLTQLLAHKRKLGVMKKSDDSEDPPAGPNQGKKTKRRRTKESESTKKPSSTKETPKDKLDWNNPEGDRYPFDLSKPLPLQGPSGHRTIAADYFFNNDLEYLKTSDPEYHQDHAYDKDTSMRESALRVKDQNVCTDLSISKFSKKNVYSTKAILGVESVSVKKLHGIWSLIKSNIDMPVLAVQHKLFHLDKSDIVDFIVALQSYQKKLNITKPHKIFPEIEFKEPYTSSYDPPGIILDFASGLTTLKNAKMKWMAIDRKRSGLMIELIDKQLREREIIRNLERLVGARELEMDYKLMTRHPFDIDLIHVELDSFDVIVEGNGCNGGSKSKLSIILCTKTQKYIQKGCQVYLAQVTAKKTGDELEEKQLEDVPIVWDFPKVFPEDLPGLPPTRKIEF
ncbi:hypothetical protein Tco_0155798 [Tanacetum coccineum]